MFGIAKGERLQSELREALEAQRRMTFLAEASKVLMGSLGYETAFANIAKLMVPMAADYCIVYGANHEVHAIIRMAHMHAKADVQEALGKHLAETTPLTGDAPLAKAARTGQAVLYEEGGSPLAIFQHEPKAMQIAALLEPKSAMILPLQTRGDRLGAMIIGITDSGRSYNNADLAFAEEVATRASLSIDNARLYMQSQHGNRLKEEFLATLSHELRTPLTAILGYARLLLAGRLDEMAGQQAIQSIHRNAQLQSQLISDLLDISRIVTGKLHLELRRVDLNEVIETVLDSARLAAEAKSHTLQFISNQADAAVNGDPDRLQQIIGNLVSNAIKFTPDGGVIEVSLRSDGGSAQITVSDNGAGVSPEFLPHVFDKFRQAENPDPGQNRGLGLGLAIVRHLVEMHEGAVYAESQGVGKGATFTIRLPLQSAAALKRAG
jgi:signal transduction histidine kinase